MTEKTIIEGRTIMKTVEGVITDVSATVATATITTSGTTEGRKSNSISEFLAGPRKSLAKQIRGITD
jgi:tRNA C32,U32 (ribose-2'-O)-methylase TrmJ